MKAEKTRKVTSGGTHHASRRFVSNAARRPRPGDRLTTGCAIPPPPVVGVFEPKLAGVSILRRRLMRAQGRKTMPSAITG